MKAKEWSNEEKNILRKHYHKKTSTELSKILNRTARAIQMQAHKQGLTTKKKKEKLIIKKFYDDGIEVNFSEKEYERLQKIKVNEV